MASYGAYYYSGTRPETKAILRPDAPSLTEEVRSPQPVRYGDRPKTPNVHSFGRRRSITPPDLDRRPARDQSQSMDLRPPILADTWQRTETPDPAPPPVLIERPSNPGSTEERAAVQLVEARPATSYVPPATAQTVTFSTQYPSSLPPSRPPERPPGRQNERPVSPDVSIVSELTEQEIKANNTSVDFYTYSKCLERVISDSNLSTPIKLGIYGKAGSGKSKTVQGVLWCLKQACSPTCNHINDPVDSPRVRWMYRSCCFCDVSFSTYLTLLFFFWMVMTLTVLLIFMLGIRPYLLDTGITINSTLQKNTTSEITSLSDAESNRWMALIVILAVVLLVAVLVLSFSCVNNCCKNTCQELASDVMANFKALAIMALCDTPPPPNIQNEKAEMVPVYVNAAEYAGAESFGLALLETLLNRCESSFGLFKYRFYRISSHDLEHEHDSRIANTEIWKTATQDKTTSTGMPFHPMLSNPRLTAKNDANHNSRPNQIKNAQPEKPTSPPPKPTSTTLKSNKIVATEELSFQPVDVPVRTAKWYAIPYPMLITIVLTLISSGIVILAVVVTSLISTGNFQAYVIAIVVCSSAMIALPILSQIRNAVILTKSLSMNPGQLIEKIMNENKRRTPMSKDIHGIMHKIKDEVSLLMGFIRQMEHIYQRKFRLLLIIDDLEKCADKNVKEIFQTVDILLSNQGFPIVTMLTIDSEHITKALTKTGMESGQVYLNQLIDMKYCIPDTQHKEVWKFLDYHTEHLLCTTSQRVNKLKEEYDKVYAKQSYRESRKELIRQLDQQHDYEEPVKLYCDKSGYYSHPVSARHISTAHGSRRTKSSKSKKHVLFTPIRPSSDEGLLGGPQIPASKHGALTNADKAVVPPVNKPEQETTTSPEQVRKTSMYTVAPSASKSMPDATTSPELKRQANSSFEKRPTTADRPESQISRIKSPLTHIRRENSALTEISSDEEQEMDEPEWMLAMSGGVSRKEIVGNPSNRRAQLADSEKTQEQITQQLSSAIAELKVTLGVSQGLISALIVNPKHELEVSAEEALANIQEIPSTIAIQNIAREKIKRHVLAYGLRKKMTLIAVEELRQNLRLLDTTYGKMFHIFNNVYLCTYIWIQKLKQLAFVEAAMDDIESDKAILKLVQTCQELVRWLILCELWPYKSSWLIYKIERVNRKMADFPSSNFYLDTSIRDIYNDIKPEIKAAKNKFKNYRQLDYSDKSFKKALEKFKDISGLSVLRYLPFTVNIDRSIKNSIKAYLSGEDKSRMNSNDGVDILTLE